MQCQWGRTGSNFQRGKCFVTSERRWRDRIVNKINPTELVTLTCLLYVMTITSAKTAETKLHETRREQVICCAVLFSGNENQEEMT